MKQNDLGQIVATVYALNADGARICSRHGVLMAERGKRRVQVVCAVCMREAYRRWRQSHIDEIRIAEAAKQRRLRAQNPEPSRRRARLQREKERNRKLEVASRPKPNICELCSEPCVTVFDHCHKTSEFRGWLCDRCNLTLGAVKDSPELLQKMIDYLHAYSDNKSAVAA